MGAPFPFDLLLQPNAAQHKPPKSQLHVQLGARIMGKVFLSCPILQSIISKANDGGKQGARSLAAQPCGGAPVDFALIECLTPFIDL